MLIDFREKGREVERGGRNINAREKHQSVVSLTHPNQRLNPDLGRLKMEPETFGLWNDVSTN